MNLRPHRKESPELSLAPLIDVVFLLLIFFMVSTTFDRESLLKVQLPDAVSRSEPVKSDQAIEIAIAADGRFQLQGEEVPDSDLASLKRRLEAISKGDRERRVMIRADAETPHRLVVRAMDAASQAGLVRIGIPTRIIKE